MNFDRDYEEFIEHLEKSCVLRPMALDRVQDAAVRLFVTYLNIRYVKQLPNKPLQPSPEKRAG